jgi:Major Facilitator Superfamily
MSWIKPYKQLEKHIYYLVGAEFLLQSINATFLILMNYYLLNSGYKDYEIADFTSFRYISVLLFGLPFGFLYKQINLLPIIRIGTILFIANAIAIVYLAPTHNTKVINFLMFLYGIFHLMSHVVALPFLLRIVDEDKRSLSLSMFFQTWAASIVFIGFIGYLARHFLPEINLERNTILMMFSIARIAIVLLYKIPKNIELISTDIDTIIEKTMSFDEWKKMLIVLIPTTIIAIGAGFSIPFFNLFFHFTYQLSSKDYTTIVALSHIIVFFTMMLSPWIKENLGYRKGIIGIQCMGITCLIIMTWANFFLPFTIALWVAMFFFMLRQPLMNSAQPLILEYTIDVIGKKNQPMISTIEASIWSGSFWISSMIFSSLRKMEIPYYQIFNVTIVLYIVGCMSWWFVFRYFKYKHR